MDKRKDPPVSEWSDPEFRKRLAEAAILFSWVLPIYNQETRNVFRLTFKEDIAVLIPQFFRDLFIHSQKYPEKTKTHLTFIKGLCSYALGETEKYPDVNLDPIQIRTLLDQWTAGLPKK